MGQSNRAMKDILAQIYGKGCFFERAKIAERIEAMGGIKTYRMFLTQKRFKKSKKISKNLTVHHLKHQSDGGETTIENCVNIAETPHQYLHSLPRRDEEIVNNMLREWKLNCVIMRGDCEIIDAITYVQPHDADFITIPVYDTVKKKSNGKPKFSRADKKQELRRLLEEYENEEDELDYIDDEEIDF